MYVVMPINLVRFLGINLPSRMAEFYLTVLNKVSRSKEELVLKWVRLMVIIVQITKSPKCLHLRKTRNQQEWPRNHQPNNWINLMVEQGVNQKVIRKWEVAHWLIQIISKLNKNFQPNCRKMPGMRFQNICSRSTKLSKKLTGLTCKNRSEIICRLCMNKFLSRRKLKNSEWKKREKWID